MPRLVFTERARADLLEAWLYIAEDNLAAPLTLRRVAAL